MIKKFFQKIRFKSLLFRLQKLTASAILLNKQFQKSSMPEELKFASDKLLDLYVGYLVVTKYATNSNK